MFDLKTNEIIRLEEEEKIDLQDGEEEIFSCIFT
jgi:hypothetical protein